jgi:hypothetical protein
MKKIRNVELLKPLLAIALGLCITAAPGYCSVVLEFETTTAGGTATVNNEAQNSTENLSSFSNVTYNEVQISGATGAASVDNGTWNISGTGLSWTNGGSGSGTLSLVGTIGTCAFGGCTSGNLDGVTGTLESATISFPFKNPEVGSSFYTTGSSPNYSLNLSFGAGTSISEAAANTSGSVNILTLLGLTPSMTSSTITGGGFSGSYLSATTFTVGSETLDVTVSSTPEPASFFLLGTGLFAIGWYTRRRSVRS